MKARLHMHPALLGLALMLAFAPASARADDSCSVESFGEAVDDSAAELRTFSAETQPRLKQKLQELRDHKGWSETDYEAKGLALVHDDRLDGFDAKAAKLLARIDTLGSPDPADPATASCANLDELKSAASELMAVMRAKSDHLIAEIDREIRATPAAVARAEPGPVAAPAAPPAAKSETPAASTPQPQPDLSPIRRTEPPRQEGTARLEPPPAAPRPAPGTRMAPDEESAAEEETAAHEEGLSEEERRPSHDNGRTARKESPSEEEERTSEHSSSWNTTTAQAVVPPPIVRPAPPPDTFQNDLPPGYGPPVPGDPPGAPYTLPEEGAVYGEHGDEEAGYTIDEIREVTRGFFGTISTSLASVIEYAFQQSGRPTAYVLGQEGGAAFLAGLRYGEGTLYLRSGGQQKVYWHGPSIGYDMGADGSRTLFLIYSLDNPENLFRRFTGVDGSAYLVGGVGMTLLRGGNVTMAPIRSGLGLRLGASIGYVRFSPRPTWNPF